MPVTGSHDGNALPPAEKADSQQVGAIRGTSTVVAPSETTTYILYATSQSGRATATLTITVQ